MEAVESLAPMDTIPTKSRSRTSLFVLKVGTLAAVLATLASALEIAVLSALGPFQSTTSAPNVWDVTRSTLLLCPITAVSCGSYGLLAGIVGSAILSWRRQRIHSTRRFLIESALAGFVFGFFFPLFDRMMNSSSLSGMQALLSAPVGMSCAILCAVVFRGHFVPRESVL
jgi:hypothetical protein